MEIYFHMFRLGYNFSGMVRNSVLLNCFWACSRDTHLMDAKVPRQLEPEVKHQ